MVCLCCFSRPELSASRVFFFRHPNSFFFFFNSPMQAFVRDLLACSSSYRGGHQTEKDAGAQASDAMTTVYVVYVRIALFTDGMGRVRRGKGEKGSKKEKVKGMRHQRW